MRIAMLLSALVMTLACEQHRRTPAEPSRAPTPSPVVSAAPVTPLTVTATVASVSLADDCATADAAALAPGPGGAAAQSSSGVGLARPSVTRMRSSASDAPRSQRARACQQTSLQLTLSTGPGQRRGVVELVRVELLDADGQAPLGDLVARNPRQWSGSRYDTWDGGIGPEAILKASWDLSAPDWTRLGGSRDAAAGRTFVVRVTLAVDEVATTATGTVTLPKAKKVKLKSPPIMVEPPVMT